jgi:hypothetical protein
MRQLKKEMKVVLIRFFTLGHLKLLLKVSKKMEAVRKCRLYMWGALAQPDMMLPQDR